MSGHFKLRVGLIFAISIGFAIGAGYLVDGWKGIEAGFFGWLLCFLWVSVLPEVQK